MDKDMEEIRQQNEAALDNESDGENEEDIVYQHEVNFFRENTEGDEEDEEEEGEEAFEEEDEDDEVVEGWDNHEDLGMID